MGKINQLNAQGVTDLPSYVIGVENEHERLINLIKVVEEQYYKASPTSPICLYPFRELLRIIEQSSAVNKSTNA
jgi:hypothetical protein